MAKCLVLGANGFIGSHLTDSLVSSGHSVRAFDRFRNNNIKFLRNDNIEMFSGDFLNRNDLENSLKDIEYLFHFISTTTPITSEADPLIDIDTNIRMSIELLQECIKSKSLKKVIFASTGGAIYGLNSTEKTSEKTNPLPISPYAIGKLTIEHYLRYFDLKFGLNSIVYRISNPYGERQAINSKQGVIPIFLEQIYNNKAIEVMGDGSMVRDYIYIKDVADMISLSFINAKDKLYNIANGSGVTINELVEVIKKVTKKEIILNNIPKPLTFIDKIILDVSKFNNEFEYSAKTNLENGIIKTWDYINNHG